MNRYRFGPGAACAAGFTLIELLVVVAIIGTLMSILLPSLNQARQHARAARCLGYCKELGHGMTLYHNEERNFPIHQWLFEDGTRIRWFDAMALYLAGFAVQQCPSTPDWVVSRNNSYGYNYKYLGSGRDNVAESNPYRPYETFPVREVRSPARTIAFADCDGTGRELPWLLDSEPDGRNPLRWGNHGYTLDPTYIPLRSLETYSGGQLEPYAWHFHRTFMSIRHLGRAATVFTDGHGERVGPRAAYLDNGMWNGLGFDPAGDPSSPYYRLDEHVDFKVHPESGQEWPFD